MWSLFFSPSDEERDGLIADLWERGTAGILEESAGCLRAFFEDEASLAGLPGEPRVEPAVTLADSGNDWDPVYAGNRFVIIPKGRIALEVNASMAFGSGRHETTQLCLRALEIYLQPGMTVLDIGCGSGILSLAAQKLAAACVIACDIQEDAVRVSRDHFTGPIFQGSADAIAAGCADVVIANISARIDDRIAADLNRILKPAGVLILSGFIAENPPQCFQPVQEFALGDWLCWICHADGIKPEEPLSDANVHPQNWY